jgi:predicted DNA-binding transcriptional regulator AlpA
MLSRTIRFEELPRAITDLTNEVNEIKGLLTQKQKTEDPSDQWLDLNELIEYDPEKRTKPTWYSKIHKNEVPHYKRDKKVYFLKSEIDEWLKEGKRKSNAELDQEAAAYLSNNKKGLK